MNELPIPRELPLPLPVGSLTLQVALVFLFLLHILFVALTVGGSVLTVFFEVRGRRRAEEDALARTIADTITVNKSLAVVLGVAPLLVINLLYTIHFYTANALTGTAWIAIVPLVATAFLLLYAHKYSWDRLAGHKRLHIAIGAAGAGLLLLVPLIFLTNINLMLFPERWADVHGFVSALALPNVLPRYLHFLLASLALTGLFLAVTIGGRAGQADSPPGGADRTRLKVRFLTVTLVATALQLAAGPLLFVTLPLRGLSWALAFNILAGLALAVAALVLLWQEITRPVARLGIRLAAVIALLSGTVIFMGYGRHLYREEALRQHRALIRERASDYEAAVLAAQMRAASGVRRGPDELPASPGAGTFRAICTGCHAMTTRLVGPPVSEIQKIYAGNPAGLIAWVRAPGKKRPDFPPMPPIRLTEGQYQAVADYVLTATH